MADLFAQKSPAIMQKLMEDFGLTIEEAAAILGNLGHECGGFRFMQELRPTVPGSRGGLGWAQWTGPRRVAFEKYCRRNGYQTHSDLANYSWLFLELRGSERGAIGALKIARGLRNKVIAFEANFERAGVKHYDSRMRYAERALQAFGAPLPPKAPKRPPRGSVEAAGGIAAGTAAASYFADGWVFHFFVFAALAAAGTGAFIYVRRNRGRLAGVLAKRLENSSGVRAVFYRLLARPLKHD